MRFLQNQSITHLTLGLGILGTLATGCSDAGPIAVQSAYAPDMALVRVGRTFDFATPTPEQAAQWNQLEDMRDVIWAEVEQRFASKGYVRSASPPADFLVRPHVAKESYNDSSVNPHGETLERGALILDIIQPSTSKTIWRGAATARLAPSLPPEQRRDRIRRGVEMLVDRFASSNK